MNESRDANTPEARQFRKERHEEPDVASGKQTDYNYMGNHEMGHMLNFLPIKEINRSEKFEERYKANDDDHRFGITASKLVEKALKKTMDPKQLEKLIR